jgi:hypothetical protein
MVNEWGPAILVCFTVLIGVVMNNKRIDDLRSELTGKIDGLEKRLNGRIDDLRSEMIARIDALEKRVDAQIAALRADLTARIDGLEKRLVDRIERLEHPVVKP